MPIPQSQLQILKLEKKKKNHLNRTALRNMTIKSPPKPTVQSSMTTTANTLSPTNYKRTLHECYNLSTSIPNK